MSSLITQYVLPKVLYDVTHYVSIRDMEQDLEVRKMLEPSGGRFTVETAIPGIAGAEDEIVVDRS